MCRRLVGIGETPFLEEITSLCSGYFFDIDGTGDKETLLCRRKYSTRMIALLSLTRGIILAVFSFSFLIFDR